MSSAKYDKMFAKSLDDISVATSKVRQEYKKSFKTMQDEITNKKTAIKNWKIGFFISIAIFLIIIASVSTVFGIRLHNTKKVNIDNITVMCKNQDGIYPYTILSNTDELFSIEISGFCDTLEIHFITKNPGVNITDYSYNIDSEDNYCGIPSMSKTDTGNYIFSVDHVDYVIIELHMEKST